MTELKLCINGIIVERGDELVRFKYTNPSYIIFDHVDSEGFVYSTDGTKNLMDEWEFLKKE